MVQELKIAVRLNENIPKLEPDQLARIQEVFTALIESGALTGVKNGKTIIHFDSEGNFMGVELDYWPFRHRKKVL